MQRRGGEAGAGRRKWLPRWDLSVCVLVREGAGVRPEGRRQKREEEEEELVGTRAPAAGEEKKEKRKAERREAETELDGGGTTARAPHRLV